MKRSRVQFLTMLVGSLLAMIIVCSQFFVLGQKSQETALVSESSEE